MNKWRSIFKTIKSHEAEIVSQVLKNKLVNNIMIDKMDSSYNNFGYYEVLISEKNYLQAMKIIENISFE
ncbi:MAG: hypothetical protein VXY09_02675 [Bacteroidota bacterium]|mgnify:FL=1|nr:hypothetical protein [Bacteroidota bacterium]